MTNSAEIQAITQMARYGATKLVRELGTVTVARNCGISRDALGRLVGDLPVQRGTILSVAHALGLLVAPTALALSAHPTASDVGA